MVAIVVGAILLAAAAASVVLAMVDGQSPLDDQSGPADRPSDAPTDRPESTATAGQSTQGDGEATTVAGTETDSATPAEPRYDVRVDHIASCGPTCRDVTATLTNPTGEPRENVTAVIRVTSGGDVLWKGTERVGRLEPGESYTTTERVDLGFGEALAVSSSGGTVTVETTVHSDAGTVTYSERRDVS